MEFNFPLYGDKKELNVIIFTKNENAFLSSLIENINLPIPLKMIYPNNEEELIEIATSEKDIPLIIVDENINYTNLIDKIQNIVEDSKIQFIVILNNSTPEIKDISLRNLFFVYKKFLNSEFFCYLLFQIIEIYLLISNNEIATRKLKRLRGEIAREKSIKSNILNSVKEGVILLDGEGCILFSNKIAEYILEFGDIEYLNTPIEKYLRFSDGEEKSFGSLISECYSKKKRLRKNMSTLISNSERTYIMNYEFVPIIDINERVYCIAFIFEDVTLQKRMWDEISKKKNLETLGLISEGIIHDLNNQLTTILASINLIKGTNCDENLYEYLVDVENASIKAKNIIGDFVSFSKGGIPLKKKGDIKALVEEVVHLLFRGSNIHTSISAESNLWNVEFDHSLMAQAIKNVLVNSREAISRSGSIIVNIGNQTIPEKNQFSVKGGKYVKISIEDDGVGIPKHLIDRIFDPNFSTKGKDRGLGLSIVNSIISNHNGFIKVDSREKVGTVFQIFLPASEEKILLNRKAAGQIKKQSNVLVLEHDPAILGVLKKIFIYFEMKANFLTKKRFTEEDFNTITAELSYDYLLIDTSGVEDRVIESFISKIKAKNPSLKVIIITHKNRYDSEEKQKHIGVNAILYKPFGLEEFGEVFGEVL
ncbi:MAG: ATP-binding protein [Brevinematia bacterium]